MSPKEQFLLTPHAQKFREMVGTEAFREAMNYALLQIQEDLSLRPRIPSGYEFAQMNGALRLRDMLMFLPAPLQTEKPIERTGLNHDAYDRPARTKSNA